jgi:hypothetical protein|tara:strand:- start:979 stop:1590 length:612 start_codon:yes stop_codon:yes gene_type:complete
MANIDSPFGLRPHNKLGSAPNSNGMTPYKVQINGVAGSSSAIYQGDMVIPLTNGLVDVSAADGGSVAILGVMAGCEYIALDGTPTFSNHYPGTSTLKSGTEATVFVYDDPTQVYEVQCDATLTNLATATALIHSNAEGAGFGSETANGISSGELSVASAGATTATDNFRIIGFKDVADIDYAAAGVVALVKLNLPFHLATTGL